MSFGEFGLGCAALASRPSTAVPDAYENRPLVFELNGENWNDWAKTDTLSLTDTLGQPVDCQIDIVNPPTNPRPGDRVRILYYDEVIFAGMVMAAEPFPNKPGTLTRWQVQCADWSVLLLRRRVRRNFVSATVASIVSSILDNELAGDGLSIGTIDQGNTLPLVDVRDAKAFDVLRDVGGATGQSMFVDHEKKIHFMSTSNPVAPKKITSNIVEDASLPEDLEGYRNVQTVTVKGTPKDNEKPVEITITKQNNAQIAARKLIEGGGSGRWEEMDTITHPTSNVAGDCTLLAIGFANLKLAVAGVPRRTLKCKVRGYGFRAGQVATVDLPELGAAGTWMIQRVRLEEQWGKHLIFYLELVQTSRQIRAFQSWIEIVKRGQIVVQLPSALTSNLQTFTSSGTFTVPAGVTQVELTCYGASGAGGGGAYAQINFFIVYAAHALGGKGGNGGKAVTTLDVEEGDEIQVFIGAAGSPGGTSVQGIDEASSFTKQGGAGTAASGTTRCVYKGVTVCQGDPGGGGQGGFVWVAVDGTQVANHGAPGTDGNGIGDAVTIGGGKVGGDGGTGSPIVHGHDGEDGLVEIRW